MILILDEGIGAIKIHHMKKLMSIPQCLDRLISMQLSTGRGKTGTLINAYAPNMSNPDEIKDELYEELCTLISSVPPHVELIVVSDFSARVGSHPQAWDSVRKAWCGEVQQHRSPPGRW